MGILDRSPQSPKSDTDGKRPPKEKNPSGAKNMILQDMNTPKGRALMLLGVAALAIFFGIRSEHIQAILRNNH